MRQRRSWRRIAPRAASALGGWALSGLAALPALELLRWDTETLVDDPYVLNVLDFTTFHATSIGQAPLQVDDIHPQCSCVAYIPDPERGTTVNPGGTATLKFLVTHDGQPEVSRKLISLRVSSQATPKMLTLEIRTPIAPKASTQQLAWTAGRDRGLWRTAEVVPPAGHPEYRFLRLVADATEVETSVEPLRDAAGAEIAGGAHLAIRPVRDQLPLFTHVDAVVATSAGERALRIAVVVEAKTAEQTASEF